MELKKLSEKLERIMVVIDVISNGDDISIKSHGRLTRVNREILDVSAWLVAKDNTTKV